MHCERSRLVGLLCARHYNQSRRLRPIWSATIRMTAVLPRRLRQGGLAFHRGRTSTNYEAKTGDYLGTVPPRHDTAVGHATVLCLFSPLFEVVPQPVGQMPWGHVRTLLGRVKSVGLDRPVQKIAGVTRCSSGKLTRASTSATAWQQET